jgi:pyruvate dehydrogenase E1 component beta subunit
LLRAAVEYPDPVVFLEPKRRYWMKEDVELPVKAEPIGRALVRRPGTTATLIAYGPMVATALEAAETAVEDGWDLEVVDVRTLSPLDVDTLAGSVTKTGRAVVVHEAPAFAGYGAEIASTLSERAFGHLAAPVLRVTGFDLPYPPAKLERHYLPGTDRILDAVARALEY